VTLTSRAMHNVELPKFAEYITGLLKYDRFVPMNGGCEADETAVKFARRWAYNVKGVPDNEAVTLFPTDNFWGRSITASGACDDPTRYNKFGPFTAGFDLFKYDDVDALRKKLEENPNICSVFIEPIQGEAGVIIPHDGYLKAVRELCTKHNVLLCADEIQTGFGRSGKLFACEWEDVRPDMLIMGKSMSGGMLPVSGVVADNEVMDHIKPGDHGSTYGGNPLAMATAHAAIQTLIEEDMVGNSARLGPILKREVENIGSHLFKEVRGRGLFVGLELKDGFHVTGADYAKILCRMGLLTKSTHDMTIRLAPALVITEEEIMESVEILKKATSELEDLSASRAKAAK